MSLPIKEIFNSWGKKHRLIHALADYPMLRMIVMSFWFRVAFVLFLMFLAAFALCFPKIWRTSPKDFAPVIRVSLLDLAQSWALRRTAVKAMAAGQNDEALHAWQAALANNPANPNLARGLLRHLAQNAASKETLGLAVQQSFWLLRLARTNQLDVELVAHVYERFRLNDYLVNLLASQSTGLSPALESLYLKALFNTGQMEAFNQRWESEPQKWQADPELRLYYAAYQSGWGVPNQVAEGRQLLEAAKANDDRQQLAHRLQMAVSLHLADAAGYEQSLRRLEAWRADTAQDHVLYWNLLMLSGRKAEAVKLAEAYAAPPQSAVETMHLAEGYARLGLLDRAYRLVQEHLAEYGYFKGLWQTYANLLIADHRWEDLQALALQIRQNSMMRDSLETYSYFLEGRAQLGQDRKPLAESAFRQAIASGSEDPYIGLLIASQLHQLGFPALAMSMLVKLEAPLKHDFYYWVRLFESAFDTRQTDYLLKAASQAYAMRPNDLSVLNNYAAALITLRVRPEEAVKVTIQIVALRPNSIAARINHALALLLNGRTLEAEAILKAISPRQLNSMEATAYHMGLFQIYYNQRKFELARHERTLIDDQHLFPSEIAWMKEIQDKMNKNQ